MVTLTLSLFLGPIILCWKLLFVDIIRIATGIVLLVLFVVALIKTLKFLKETSEKKKYNEDTVTAYIAISCVAAFILFVASMLAFFA